MRTLLVSDLHLGLHTRADVLRRPELARILFDALDGVDRLVLLGDALELRSGPIGGALAAAREFFDGLGRALDGRPVVLVPGNHDHALIAPWLERRSGDLGRSERVSPAEASPAAATLAGFLGPGAAVSLAYPGVWVRDDVYATHGHYLDCHVTVPTVERIAIGAMGRVAGLGAGGPRCVRDYEALVAPVYAWIHAVAQGGRPGVVNGSGSARAWRALSGGQAGLRARALGAAFPLGVGLLNRVGLGPLRSDLSGDELRRSRLLAVAEVVSRLGVDARHVVFGHTHRTGPLVDDTPGDWVTVPGTRLWNCGSWVFETHLMTRAVPASPYWPGGCVVVEDAGPPRLVRLLDGVGVRELGGTGVTGAAA